MEKLRFTVYGTPATAGSKRGFPIKRKDGTIGVAMVDDSKNGKNWRADVKTAATTAMSEARLRLFDGPVRLELTFVRSRPKSHFRTGRNSHLLRSGAPHYPDTRPDLTKMLRAVEDALKGIVWRDDGQVVGQSNWKQYGEAERAEISVEQLPRNWNDR